MQATIISCAVTGSIHTPSMSPHLPVNGEQIAEQAIEAARAGASILHLHARHPQDGRPSAAVEHYAEFIPLIAAETDAIINITTGGSAIMTLEDRLAAAQHYKPEMCSLNMGSMNFALYPMADMQVNWKHDWEQPFLRDSDALIFRNTPKDIAGILQELGAHSTRFEFECYDISHLYMLRHFVRRGLIKSPIFVQFVFGVLGGIGADPECFAMMKATADRLLGNDYQFSALGAGRAQMPMAALSSAQNGHIRVGLEDSLFLDKGILAPNNAAQVKRASHIVDGLGRTIATPTQTRAMLGLKGKEKTSI